MSDDGEGVRKKDLTPEMIRHAVERSARASMALEGRVVPEGYVRTERVERFLETRPSATDSGVAWAGSGGNDDGRGKLKA